MKCQRCGQREATVTMTRTVQGRSTEQRLCEPCARETGMLGAPFLFGNWFSPGSVSETSIGGILQTGGGIPAFGGTAVQNPICPVCGESYEEFRQTGLFGCRHCYQTFGDRLDAMFRRIQAGVRHVGRGLAELPPTQAPAERQAPQSGLAQASGVRKVSGASARSVKAGQSPESPREQLRRRLKAAVEAEQYEEAARLRDEIRQLEQETDDTSNGGA